MDDRHEKALEAVCRALCHEDYKPRWELLGEEGPQFISAQWPSYISRAEAAIRAYLAALPEPARAEGGVTVTIFAQGDHENTPAEAVHHALTYAHKAGFIDSWSDPEPARAGEAVAWTSVHHLKALSERPNVGQHVWGAPKGGVKVPLFAAPAPTVNAGVEDHKWLDPECGVNGCQSLVWKSRYESAVKGRADFRQAYREARSALPAPTREEVLEEMPETNDRSLFDDDDPDGYLESDTDWASENWEAVRWLADNHVAIRRALARAKP